MPSFWSGFAEGWSKTQARRDEERRYQETLAAATDREVKDNFAKAAILRSQIASTLGEPFIPDAAGKPAAPDVDVTAIPLSSSTVEAPKVDTEGTPAEVTVEPVATPTATPSKPAAGTVPSTLEGYAKYLATLDVDAEVASDFLVGARKPGADKLLELISKRAGTSDALTGKQITEMLRQAVVTAPKVQGLGIEEIKRSAAAAGVKLRQDELELLAAQAQKVTPGEVFMTPPAPAMKPEDTARVVDQVKTDYLAQVAEEKLRIGSQNAGDGVLSEADGSRLQQLQQIEKQLEGGVFTGAFDLLGTDSFDSAVENIPGASSGYFGLMGKQAEAAKARANEVTTSTLPNPDSTAGGKVYSSKEEVQAAIEAGEIPTGATFQFKAPDGKVYTYTRN